MPGKRGKHSHGTLISFLIGVAAPVFAVLLYLVFIAPNRYTAEFRFSVQDASQQAASTAMAATSMMQMLGGPGTVNSSQNYLVVDFLRSSEAIRELERRIGIVGRYSKPEVFWWSRFTGNSLDEFNGYWRHQIYANYDQVTGLAQVTVKAFTPNDAYEIGTTLVTLSEELINKISTRQQQDAVKLAEQEVRKAEDRLRGIQDQVTALRNRTGIIDPTNSVIASNSALAQSLRGTLAQLETNLTIMRRQNLNISAPAVQAVQTQIRATKEQLARVETSVADPADARPLSSVVEEFENLNLERGFAQTSLTSAMGILDQARAAAAHQRLYITPYVRPSPPTKPSDPRILVPTAIAAAVFFMLWAIGMLLVRAIKEHYV